MITGKGNIQLYVYPYHNLIVWILHILDVPSLASPITSLLLYQPCIDLHPSIFMFMYINLINTVMCITSMAREMMLK